MNDEYYEYDSNSRLHYPSFPKKKSASHRLEGHDILFSLID